MRKSIRERIKHLNEDGFAPIELAIMYHRSVNEIERVLEDD